MESLYDYGKKKKINNIFLHNKRKRLRRKKLKQKNLPRKRNQNNYLNFNRYSLYTKRFLVPYMPLAASKREHCSHVISMWELFYKNLAFNYFSINLIIQFIQK
jgi:hypothetical protein